MQIPCAECGEEIDYTEMICDGCAAARRQRSITDRSQWHPGGDLASHQRGSGVDPGPPDAWLEGWRVECRNAEVWTDAEEGREVRAH